MIFKIFKIFIALLFGIYRRWGGLEGDHLWPDSIGQWGVHLHLRGTESDLRLDIGRWVINMYAIVLDFNRPFCRILAEKWLHSHIPHFFFFLEIIIVIIILRRFTRLQFAYLIVGFSGDAAGILLNLLNDFCWIFNLGLVAIYPHGGPRLLTQLIVMIEDFVGVGHRISMVLVGFFRWSGLFICAIL